MFFILYRDPKSRLVSDWHVQGSAPTHSYATKAEAIEAAKELAQYQNYDTCVFELVAGSTIRQSDL